MAKVTKPKGKKADLIGAYMDYLLTNGKRPVTVFRFCKDLGLKESDFYATAGSFSALEVRIWGSLMDEAISRVKSDAGFSSYSAREKVLTLYFSILESINQHRSFLLLTGPFATLPKSMPACLKDFQKHFTAFMQEIMAEGKISGEVAARPVLEQQYPNLFSLHLQFFLQYWAKDDSPGFEQTDAFVEKSVNLAFDLIAKGALDSALDLAKFLFRQKSFV